MPMHKTISGGGRSESRLLNLMAAVGRESHYLLWHRGWQHQGQQSNVDSIVLRKRLPLPSRHGTPLTRLSGSWCMLECGTATSKTAMSLISTLLDDEEDVQAWPRIGNIQGMAVDDHSSIKIKSRLLSRCPTNPSTREGSNPLLLLVLDSPAMCAFVPLLPQPGINPSYLSMYGTRAFC